MKRHFINTLVIVLILLAIPNTQYGQEVKNHSIKLELEKIVNPDYRYCMLAYIVNDSNFDYTIDEEDNSVLLYSAEHWSDSQFQNYFDKTLSEIQNEFSTYDSAVKETRGTMFSSWKDSLPEDLFVLLFRLMLMESPNYRDGNQTCATSDPFCTTDVVTFHVEANPGGSCENGPHYGCLAPYIDRPPFWFHMKIGVAGAFTIRMTNSANVDIDYCCWGPFNDPVTPCPSQLTQSKYIDCGSSGSANEECDIPSSAQVGQYYIMVITKYNQSTATNITFQKKANSGPGETDCGILPPLVDNDGPFCVGDPIHLTANGQAGASYSWSGPNGYTSNQQNPTINNCNLSHTGSYTCTITLGNQSNNASTEVAVYAKPTANFTATSVCKGEPTQFTSTSTTNPSGQNITSYLWDFGDGQTSTQQDPTHTYTEAGNKTVTLTVGVGHGTCTSSKTQTVTVNAVPVANAGNDQTIIYGATAQLSGSGGNGSFNYHWEPANLVVNPNAQNTQTVGLSASQTFTLTVTNPQGNCSDTDDVTISIEGSNMTLSPNANPSTICEGSSTTLNAHAVGGSGNFTYNWSPSTGLNSTTIATPTASPTTTTTYTCTASDGYTTLSGTVTITVNHPEYSEETAYTCPDEPYQWNGQYYTGEGDYLYETTTAQGCYKAITLHLHYYPTYAEGSVTYASICHGDSYPFHGQSYNTTGRYSHTLETVHGCDSIVWLDLTVYPDNGVTEHPWTTCEADLPYQFNGVYFNQAVDTIFTMQDMYGCDSLVRFVLTINEYTILPTEKHYLCYDGDTPPPFTWSANGQTYEGEMIVQTDILPYGNCQGIYSLEVHQLKTPTVVQETVTDCDSYEWIVEGVTVGNYTTSGDYHYSIPIYYDSNDPSTRFDCDREFVLHLTVNYSDQGSDMISSQCDSVPFTWFGQTNWYSENGVYEFNNGLTTLGCDSTFILRIEDMKYTPIPLIVCTDNGIAYPHYPITATEFNVNRYTYAVTDPHTTDTYTVEWSISKDTWPIRPQGLTCEVYAMDWSTDTVWLNCKVKNICESVGIETSYYLIPSFYGVQEQEYYPASVSIFPNPNNGQMQMRFENMEGKLSIKVFGSTGVLADSFEITTKQAGETYNYSMKRLNNGVYFFVITDGKRSITKKVVIIN
ncbi:MAG: PKD domain-containing protein [Bacteroidales bacterium]|nr:PKD domain-containing protein [Bacteroidales bacterium]